MWHYVLYVIDRPFIHVPDLIVYRAAAADPYSANQSVDRSLLMIYNILAIGIVFIVILLLIFTVLSVSRCLWRLFGKNSAQAEYERWSTALPIF